MQPFETFSRRLPQTAPRRPDSISAGGYKDHLLPVPPVVNRTRLDHGMVLLHEPEANAPFLALRLTSRVGAIIDPWEKAGQMSLAGALLEAGTSRLTEDEIAQRFEGRGATFDVDVSKDTLTVTLISLVDCFVEDLDLLFHIVGDPVYPQEAFLREQEMLRMAICEAEDDLLTFTARRFNKSLYGRHPYGVSVMGTRDTVDRLTRDEVADAIWTSLRPDRMVATLVGGGEKEIDALRERLAGFQGRGDRPAPASPEIPARSDERRIVVEKDREAACVVMGFRGPSVLDGDTVPMRVLDGVMGGAMDSRLFQLIREEKGLAYQVGSTLLCGRCGGQLAMYALTMPEHVEQVIEVAMGAFDRMVNEPVLEDELNRTIHYLLGNGLMGLETRASRSSEYCVLEALGMGYEQVFEVPRRVAEIKASDVQEVAERYLHDPLVVITRPGQDATHEASPE